MQFTAKAFSSDGTEGEHRFDVPRLSIGDTFVSVPDTIPGADDSDQSAALQAWFDSVGDGVRLYIPKMYRYDAAGPRLYGRHDIEIFGPGGFTTPTDGYDVEPTLEFRHKWPRARKRFYAEDCDRLTIREITLEGSNQTNMEEVGYVSALEGQHALDFNGCRDVLVEDVIARFVRGDFLRVASTVVDGVRKTCSRVTVRRGDFHHNGRQGFGIVGVEDLLVEDSKVDYVRRTTIDGEPNSDDELNVRVTFRRNAFGVGHGPWIALHRRGRVEDWLFDDNDIQKAAAVLGTQPEGARIRRVSLINNRSHAYIGNPQEAAWKAQGIDGLTATGNVITVQPSRKMVLVAHRDCTGVDVHDNTIVNGIGEVREGW